MARRGVACGKKKRFRREIAVVAVAVVAVVVYRLRALFIERGSENGRMFKQGDPVYRTALLSIMTPFTCAFFRFVRR